MPRKKKASPKQDLRFEDAVERLENIIGRMETERIPLDDLLKDYEEGTQLLNYAGSVLITHGQEWIK
jgi:exodeoxyribonuclease VII small subunit